MQRQVPGAQCRIRFAPCPPPACGQLLLYLRKANAALRSLNRWWQATSRHTAVIARAVMGRADLRR
jgi:hypothetical protein